MPIEGFRCRQCGKCCREKWEINLDFDNDILRWVEYKRFDILKHVVLNPKYHLNPQHYNYRPQWMLDCGHILFGDISFKCPFLEEAVGDFKASCRIHRDRPQICRKFPYDERGEVRSDILDICEGAIFYHSQAADIDGMGLIERIERLEKAKVNEGSPVPLKEELIKIAGSFKGKNLKISLMGREGLDIVEGAWVKENLQTKEIQN